MIVSPRLLFASTLLLAASSVAGALAGDFTFHAEAGSRVVRTFDFELEMELESMTMTVGGNPVPADHTEGVEMTMGERTHLLVTDEYGAAEDGRPATLRRTFDELSGESSNWSTGPQGESETNAEKSSELEGSTVVFTWDAEAEAYEVEFEDSGDADLLAGLEEDLDLRGFLPDGDVEEGDTWETDLEPFRRVFEPGGDLGLRAEGNPRSGVDDLILENLEGSVQITYLGTRDDEGVEVAVLQLEISAATTAEASLESEGGGEVEQFVTMEFELEGELAWALEPGRLHGLEIAGDLASEITNTSEFGGAEQPMDFVQAMSFEGEVSYALSVAPE